MVYIYKKTIGEKNYYSLRASERKGKKVIVKDISYLGNSIEEVKSNLNKLNKYKEEIRKAYRTINVFLESNYYLEKVIALKLKKDVFIENKLNEVESCKLHYSSKFQKLDNLTKKEILKNFVIEFSFNTTSIEGNTINLIEAKNLLQDGMTPKNKTLREIYDLQNTEKVFFELFETKKNLTDELIISIHDKLIENIDFREGYRTQDIRVINSNFDASPAPYVKTDMSLLLKWYEKNKKILHPLCLATIFHHKFEKIHPFMDGNGRTGRMLFNYILILNNYPPIIISKKNRKMYLDSLRKADNSNLNGIEVKDYSHLIQFMCDELISSYWNIFL